MRAGPLRLPSMSSIRGIAGIHLLRLDARHVVIHLVGDLRLGLETLRRDPARGRDDEGAPST